ncbi:hypothetical protein M0804_004669 [Polistes exclamans]|nr:hypothetical protein M0804_004669 [Polistes exclamans]
MSNIEDWRSSELRTDVLEILKKAVETKHYVSKFLNVFEMENRVFQKAKTKREYLEFVGRLIIHSIEKKT